MSKKFFIAIVCLLIGVGVFIVIWRINKTSSVTAPVQSTENIVNSLKVIKVEDDAFVKKADALSKTDQDLDGLSDTEEKQLGTNPGLVDTDNDGLLDKDEVQIYKTNPVKKDSDGDGYLDGYEVKRGFSPIDKNSHVVN